MNSTILFNYTRTRLGGSQAQYDALLQILNAGVAPEVVATFIGMPSEVVPVQPRPVDAPKGKYALSKRSLDRLVGVNPKLVNVVKEAILRSPVYFMVVEGLRTKETQAEYVKKGASKTMNSFHLTGHAVDLAPLENGAIDWSNKNGYFDKLAVVMKEVAKEQGVDITWGGNWKTLVDKPHYQIPR